MISLLLAAANPVLAVKSLVGIGGNAVDAYEALTDGDDSTDPLDVLLGQESQPVTISKTAYIVGGIALVGVGFAVAKRFG